MDEPLRVNGRKLPAAVKLALFGALPLLVVGTVLVIVEPGTGGDPAAKVEALPTAGNGSFISTLGAPPKAMPWMESEHLIFTDPLPDDTPTIDDSPVIARQIDEIVRGQRLYEYGSGIEDDTNSPHFVLVDSDREQFTEIRFHPEDCGGDGSWWSWTSEEFEPYINGAYGEQGPYGVPLPAGFQMSPNDSDFHLVIYDWRTDTLIELWRAKTSNVTGNQGIEVCWGGITADFATSGTGVFPFPLGVTAAGLASPGLAITLADVQQGQIAHAIGVSAEIAIDNQDARSHSYPANRNDGQCSDERAAREPDVQQVTEAMGGEQHCLREGQRLRLPAGYDTSSISHPYARLIAEAARDYGLVLQDMAGCFCLQAESGTSPVVNGVTPVNPWDQFLAGATDQEVMSQVEWSALEILPPDWNQPEGHQIACATPPASAAPGGSPAENPLAGDPRCERPADPYTPG